MTIISIVRDYNRDNNIVDETLDLLENIKRQFKSLSVFVDNLQHGINFLSLTETTKEKYNKKLKNIIDKISSFFDCNMPLNRFCSLINDSSCLLYELQNIIEKNENACYEDIEPEILFEILNNFILYSQKIENRSPKFIEAYLSFIYYKGELKTQPGNKKLRKDIINNFIKTWEEIKDNVNRFNFYGYYLLLKLRKDPNFKKEIENIIKKIIEARKEIEKLANEFESSLTTDDIVNIYSNLIKLVLNDKYEQNLKKYPKILENELKEFEDPVDAIYSSLLKLVDEIGKGGESNIMVLQEIIRSMVLKLNNLKHKIGLIIDTWVTVIVKLINYYVYNLKNQEVYIEKILYVLKKFTNFLEVYNHDIYKFREIKIRRKEAKEFLSVLYTCFINIKNKDLKDQFLKDIYPCLTRGIRCYCDLKELDGLYERLEKLTKIELPQSSKNELSDSLKQSNVLNFFDKLFNETQKTILMELVDIFEDYLKKFLTSHDFTYYYIVLDELFFDILWLIYIRFIPNNTSEEYFLTKMEISLNVLNKLLNIEDLNKIFLSDRSISNLTSIRTGLEFIIKNIENEPLSRRDKRELKEKIKETVNLISNFENRFSNIR